MAPLWMSVSSLVILGHALDGKCVVFMNVGLSQTDRDWKTVSPGASYFIFGLKFLDGENNRHSLIGLL